LNLLNSNNLLDTPMIPINNSITQFTVEGILMEIYSLSRIKSMSPEIISLETMLTQIIQLISLGWVVAFTMELLEFNLVTLTI
jgi:hypothetical protein